MSAGCMPGIFTFVCQGLVFYGNIVVLGKYLIRIFINISTEIFYADYLFIVFACRLPEGL